MMSVDFHEVEKLAADLLGAPVRVAAATVAVVHRGANNIVRDARQNAPKSAVARHYPATITYDLEVHGVEVEAEIGPDRDLNGQAKLGNLFEYGSVNNAPQAHLQPALDHELPRFERYLAEAGVKAMLR